MADAERPAGEKALTRAQMMFQGQNSPKKKKKIHLLEQWIEVRIEEGKTVTTLYPSNQILLKHGQTMWPPPDLVYRRFNFPDGVPEEYRWVGMTEERATLGGSGLQRMTVDTWLQVIEREPEEIPRVGYQSAVAPGHVGPTGVGNLPRPQERGECECPVCTKNQAILDRLTPEDQ